MADQTIWAFSEKPALLAELIAGARQLSGAAAAVVVGTRTLCEQVLAAGADRVYWLGETSDTRLVEDYVPTLAALVTEQQPAALLIGATKRGKAVAGRLAARLGTSTITDVKRLSGEPGSYQAEHLIFGGGAVRTEQPHGLLLCTVGQAAFEPLPPEPGRTGPVVEVPFVAPPWQVQLRERKEKPPASVNLAAAKRVVCPGRGLAKEEDLALMRELAQLLEAEIGCTRPLAEGLNWLPRERYIGVSGANLKADLYIGIGVSGQVQHTVGISEAHVVVAINKDKTAAIFQQADYGIVGDLYTVVPALIKALQARK